MSSSRLAQEQLAHLPSPIYRAIGPPSFPSRPGSSVQIDCYLEGSLTKRSAHRETRKWSANTGRCLVTIDMLPDIALLEIFEFYMDKVRERRDEKRTSYAWYSLVHVCQKWRTVVFGSPRRLDLQLYCTGDTPVKEALAIWPPLPIVIVQYIQPTRMDNIIVALEHIDRVCQIILFEVTNSQLEEILAVTQQPFPALTKLGIWWEDQTNDEIEKMLKDDPPPVIPKSFLGGSAPRLQYLTLERISFPGLPKFLLSASDLVTFRIWEVPHSGYISPETMVRCLSTLARLSELWIGFQSPLSRPVQKIYRPLPPTRSLLLALTYFRFEGVSEYLEDLVTRIDVPRLNSLHIRFFHQLIFNTPRLTQFVARTPNIQPPVEVQITFFDHYVEVTSPRTRPRKLVLGIRCIQPDWQLSSLAQVFASSLPEAFISTVERLCIYMCKFSEPSWQDDIEDSQWLEALRPFTAVKLLYLSRKFTSRIGPALQELAGEVLPSLQKIFLDGLDPMASGPVQGGIGNFVAARELSSHPVAISLWDRDKDDWP